MNPSLLSFGLFVGTIGITYKLAQFNLLLAIIVLIIILIPASMFISATNVAFMASDAIKEFKENNPTGVSLDVPF